jgi:ribose transport system ATP-binding protein
MLKNMDSSGSILVASNLHKHYGATIALEAVSLTLYPGEVCGLLGENGAGKSTLVKILSGIVLANAGEIQLNGSPYRPHDITDAKDRGVSTAFQELSLIPTLSVAVNLFLPKPKTNAVRLVSTRAIEAEGNSILRQYGIADLPSSTLAGDLPLGLRQRVEIVRAIMQMPRVLLLDEPTAALSDRAWLFKLIDEVLARGTSILYITHRLDEVRRLCQRCVILRNGKKVFDAPVAGMTDEDVFEKMAGRSVVETFPVLDTQIENSGPPALEARDLFASGIDGVSFKIRRGEVLGLAALEGHGQSSLFKTLVGLNHLRQGGIEVGGREVSIKSPRAARHAGIVLVPEERKSEGIFHDLSTAANISLPVINQVSPFDIVDRKREGELVARGATRVDLSDHFLPPTIDTLSGGNQQKAILARALMARPKCLLLFDPTRGVDVGTKQTIYRVIRAFVREGGAALLYSTELDELVHLSDRCIVMYRGAIVAELPQDKLTPHWLLSLAAGHHGAAPLEP